LKLPPLLTASPAEAGEAVFRGLDRRKDVIYVRSIWHLVMLVIRVMPERIFKRLKL
jgi:short-subunit dehydrogenase